MYCAFYLEPLGNGPISKRLRDYNQVDNGRFIDALERELKSIPETEPLTTIYLGGGTPTELSQPDFEHLFEIIHRTVNTDAVREWTIEANPGTLTQEKISYMLNAGVTRTSLGVQSFDPDTLEFMGRLHDANEALDSFYKLREAGCQNISVDLMLALPGRNEEALQKDIDRLVELDPEHASAYILELDHDAPLQTLADKGLFTEVKDEEAARQYHQLRTELTNAGFQHYEISNFAKPGFESRHNQHYWAAGEYYGCGPSASGHLDGERYKNVPNLQKYCHYLEQNESPVCEHDQVTDKQKAGETLMLALRTRRGIDDATFQKKTGFSYFDLRGQEIAALINEGLLEFESSHLRLTDRALVVSDTVFAELI